MIFKSLSGRETKLDLKQSKYPRKDENTCKSKLQYRAGQELTRFFGCGFELIIKLLQGRSGQLYERPAGAAEAVCLKSLTAPPDSLSAVAISDVFASTERTFINSR